MSAGEANGRAAGTREGADAGSSPRGKRHACGALVAMLLLFVAAERGRWFVAVRGLGQVDRTWIWSADPPRRIEPGAFFVARDFELAAPPARAELEIVADPDYLAFVNGARIGSGRPPGAEWLDRFDVSTQLRPGTNRIVFELRSATGGGAVTARIVDGAGRVLVATDERWVVYRNSWRGLLTGEPLYPTGDVAVIGRSPFGRWSEPASAPLRPRFDEVTTGERWAPVSFQRAGASNWVPVRRLGRRLPPRVVLDFGREVTGYLYLELAPRERAEGLVRYRVADEGVAAHDPDVVVLTPANRASWQDSEPRRFRYVELVGLGEAREVALFPVTEAGFAALARPAAGAGLLGARPFPVRLPVVDEIWRRDGGPPAPAPASAPNG